MTIGVVESNKTPPGTRVWQDIARVQRFEGVEPDRTIDGGPYLGIGDPSDKVLLCTLPSGGARASRRHDDE